MLAFLCSGPGLTFDFELLLRVAQCGLVHARQGRPRDVLGVVRCAKLSSRPLIEVSSSCVTFCRFLARPVIS